MCAKKISISWDEFNGHVPKLFQDLHMDKVFADVTLATNDNRQVMAHKVILSHCSLVFRNILQANLHPNPLIYLSNLSFHEVQSVLQFMYLGECQIKNEDIEKFTKLGQEYKISGLYEVLDGNFLIETEREVIKKEPEVEELLEEEDDLAGLKEFLKKPLIDEECVAITRSEEFSLANDDPKHHTRYEEPVSVDWWSISNDIKLPVEDVPNIEMQEVVLPDDIKETLRAKPFLCEICNNRFAYSKGLQKHKRLTGHGTKLGCNVCKYKAADKEDIISHWQKEHVGKENLFACNLCENSFAKYTAMTKHKKYMHGERPYKCDQCDYRAAKQGILNKHISIMHEGKRVACPVCKVEFVSRANLRVHQKNIHEGVRFPCNECDYSATQIQGLKGHIRVKHQGVRFECDQCQYKGTGKANLQMHKDTKHVNKKYQCNQCDFLANHPSSLNIHIKNRHEENVTSKCDQCEKEYTGYDGLQKLQRHKDAIHNGIRYNCDLCDHVSMYSHGLSKHKQTKHQKALIPKLFKV